MTHAKLCPICGVRPSLDGLWKRSWCAPCFDSFIKTSGVGGLPPDAAEWAAKRARAAAKRGGGR